MIVSPSRRHPTTQQALLFFWVLGGLGCPQGQSSPKPAQPVPEPPVPDRSAPNTTQQVPEAAKPAPRPKSPRPDAVEVVKIPWDGEVVKIDEMCPDVRTSSFPAAAPYRRIELQKAGAGIRETAYFNDHRHPVGLEVGGCTHETATFTFTLDGALGEDTAIATALNLLKNTPLTGRGPIYQEEILEAFKIGTREEPNVIYHNAMIVYDVEAANDKTRVEFHYDFAL